MLDSIHDTMCIISAETFENHEHHSKIKTEKNQSSSISIPAVSFCADVILFCVLTKFSELLIIQLYQAADFWLPTKQPNKYYL